MMMTMLMMKTTATILEAIQEKKVVCLIHVCTVHLYVLQYTFPGKMEKDLQQIRKIISFEI